MAARSTVVRHTDIIIIPVTFKEADAKMSRLRDIEQEIAEIDAKLTADIARLRERAKAKAAPLKEARTDIWKSLTAWAKINYRKIVTRYGKSMRFTHGVIKYRYDPPSVTVKKIGEKRMIIRMKKKGHGHYVRKEESLNRELLLEERPYISGITYRQAERCRICPDPLPLKKPRVRDPSVQAKPA